VARVEANLARCTAEHPDLRTVETDHVTRCFLYEEGR